MTKRYKFSLVVLLLLIIDTICTFALFILFLRSPNITITDSFFMIMIGFILIYFISIIGLYLFRRKYLRSKDKYISSNRNTKYILFLISGILPLIVDIIWSGKEFAGIEILVVGILLSSANVFRSNSVYQCRSFKEKYLLSLSFNLSSTLLYLFFISIYAIYSSGIVNSFYWKDLFSSFLSFVPNIISRVFLLFPNLLIITIATATFTKIKYEDQEYYNYDEDDENILDSNIFR